MRRIWFVLSLATAGLMAGETSSSPAPIQPSAPADVVQEQEIRARLDGAQDLRNNYIGVRVDDGIAVLEGVVDSQAEKKEAQQLAHVEGVLGVNNHLQVGAPVKHPTKD